MLQILEQMLIEQKCAVRLYAPQDTVKFTAVAVAGNGVPLAAGLGETLEEAVRDMLEQFEPAEKEKSCVPV